MSISPSRERSLSKVLQSNCFQKMSAVLSSPGQYLGLTMPALTSRQVFHPDSDMLRMANPFCSSVHCSYIIFEKNSTAKQLIVQLRQQMSQTNQPFACFDSRQEFCFCSWKSNKLLLCGSPTNRFIRELQYKPRSRLSVYLITSPVSICKTNQPAKWRTNLESEINGTFELSENSFHSSKMFLSWIWCVSGKILNAAITSSIVRILKKRSPPIISRCSVWWTDGELSLMEMSVHVRVLTGLQFCLPKRIIMHWKYFFWDNQALPPFQIKEVARKCRRPLRSLASKWRYRSLMSCLMSGSRWAMTTNSSK